MKRGSIGLPSAEVGPREDIMRDSRIERSSIDAWRMENSESGRMDFEVGGRDEVCVTRPRPRLTAYSYP